LLAVAGCRITVAIAAAVGCAVVPPALASRAAAADRNIVLVVADDESPGRTFAERRGGS
jgi:hypothetical protein